MKSIKIDLLWRIFMVLMVIGCVACSNDDDDDDDDDDEYDLIEQLALDKYMEGIADAEQQLDYDGTYSYYIVPIDLSVNEGVAGEDAIWVRYNITSWSLDGDVCNTRYESVAKQMNTFTYSTRYSPMTKYAFIDEEDDDDDDDDDDEEYESLVLALKQGIEIGGVKRSLYAGNKFRIYSPSRLNGTSYNGTGGYAGQFSLSGGRPMVSEIEITEIVANSDLAEQAEVEAFMNMNNPSSWKAVRSQSVSKGVYINQDYTPDFYYTYPNQYPYGELPTHYDEDDNEVFASSFEELEDLMLFFINEDGDYEESEDPSIAYDGSEMYTYDEDEGAKIWYILRTLDGFVLDTNLYDISMITVGSSSSSSYIYYYESTEDDYIDAWKYAIPDLEYGKWASILTVSSFAYGDNGQTGDSSTTEIPPCTPLLFNIFIEAEE